MTVYNSPHPVNRVDDHSKISDHDRESSDANEQSGERLVRVPIHPVHTQMTTKSEQSTNGCNSTELNAL